ncbi:probable inactive dual specificity protein phosphatase-like At4g18593 isoform X1 [Telopea speciosissima]|uniref:probable inactive dual specificity protein phosphatase-like At4g18593 isoform X1 n=2 Tax=Telopea speciosissima TaxID=54955 RepID=UPI001CC53136|nr:probable inactive dual specificity protein phosphatase-like At4g18593 isoform X1 [Telopea speciosissima]
MCKFMTVENKWKAKKESKESYIIHTMAAANSSDLVTDPKLIFRCKKCRRIVAAQENVVIHERGEGEICFKWKKRSGDPGERDKEPPECSSIFVEPMKWMQTVEEGNVENKLQCLGCNARLGSFNWAGMQCSCGAWVTPAFQLHKSRIDECRT